MERAGGGHPRGVRLMRRRAVALLAALVAAPSRAASPEDAAALLADRPGWTAEPGGTAVSPGNLLALRTYVRDDGSRAARAILVLSVGENIAPVARMMSERLLAEMPRRLRIWTLNGRRAWMSFHEDGMVYELGVVLALGGRREPAAVLTVTGEGLVPEETVAFLASLDWAAMRAVRPP